VLLHWEARPSLSHHDAEEHAVIHHLILEPEIKGSHLCRKNQFVISHHHSCKIHQTIETVKENHTWYC
jgi:hypothetical protein